MNPPKGLGAIFAAPRVVSFVLSVFFVFTAAAQKLSETIAIPFPDDPRRSIVIERTEAIEILEGEVVGRKNISEKQFEQWSKELGGSLKLAVERDCPKPVPWTLAKGPNKTEYAYCPEKSERTKNILKTLREIQKLIGRWDH